MKIEAQLTDSAILNELGKRIEGLRLSKNLTQSDSSEEAGVSKRTIERLEAGYSVQLSSLIRVFRVLGVIEGFNTILPEPVMSPMTLLKLHGKARQRASKKQSSKVQELPKPWTWKDNEL
ncbi:MAG: hypothetical protein A3F67_04520 [Verrucomicrobia bacterium RIFCSPHIGHO2_12_FULL_41_10]|nr:MAG: hypothetical protein A3F67_04520 [Verrucomicrobia bacterium RIFCSPHIGHO2_12_FULL_41_10]HLB32660.1 helix-turn-helix transcriptional regulator [Chthoniobacterales bacterium]